MTIRRKPDYPALVICYSSALAFPRAHAVVKVCCGENEGAYYRKQSIGAES